MTRDPAWLLEHSGNVYSQSGEDGVIAAALDLLPTRDKWCVEFGAFDGVSMSNTRCLIENAGYTAVLIEASETAFADLLANCSSRPTVHAVHALVGFTDRDNLDVILDRFEVPHDFDCLSIDVDGNDYHVWKAMVRYRPKVICIEFNQTIPTEVKFVQRADVAVNQGSSLQSLVELGREKGYELVSVLAHNAFFVDRRYYALFGIDDNRPERLRRDLSAITYIFCGYDGTVHLAGNKSVIWHQVPLKESRIQHLPRRLRKFPDHYTRIERFAFALLVGWPLRISNGIRRRLRWIRQT